MKVLDRLPIYNEPTLINVQGDVYQVWQNQVILWVSLAEDLQPFPAILDTGHSHNFSIARHHLDRWGGQALKQIGEAKIGGFTVPRYASELYIHRNAPGTNRLRDRYPLRMDGGIAVVHDSLPFAPRLPLLEIRAIISNRLRLFLDGDRRQVTLRTKGWF